MRRLSVWLAGAAVAVLGAGSAVAEIPIATVGPMTGQYAKFGEQMRAGAQMAVKDINAAGGTLGQPLSLEIGDDACDPKQAVAVANQLVNKGVVFVAGHFCSGSSIPASEVYAEEGVLQISPASTNPLLTERGLANVFRVCGRDDQQGRVAADFVIDNKVAERIAVVHDKTAYGKGLADEFKKRLNERGVQEVLYEAVTAGEKDFTALITKLKDLNVDLIYYGGYHTEAGLIVRQAREQGLQAIMMSGDALVTDEYWQITGPAGEGTIMTFSPDPRKNPAAREVVERFLKEMNYDPEGYTLYTYAAIQVFDQAAEKAGSTELDALVDVLRKDEFDTVIGKIRFDEKGDVIGSNYTVYIWHDGKYIEYAEYQQMKK